MFKAHRGRNWSVAALGALSLAVRKESSLFSWPPCPLTEAIGIVCCSNSHLWPWPPHQGIWPCDSYNIKSITRRNTHQCYQGQFHANWEGTEGGRKGRYQTLDRQGLWDPGDAPFLLHKVHRKDDPVSFHNMAQYLHIAHTSYTELGTEHSGSLEKGNRWPDSPGFWVTYNTSDNHTEIYHIMLCHIR